MCRGRTPTLPTVNQPTRRKNQSVNRQGMAGSATGRHLRPTTSLCTTQRILSSVRLYLNYAWSDLVYLTHQDSRSHSAVCFALGEHTGTFHAHSNKRTMVSRERALPLPVLEADRQSLPGSILLRARSAEVFCVRTKLIWILCKQEWATQMRRRSV